MPNYRTNCLVCGAEDFSYFAFADYDLLPIEPTTGMRYMSVCACGGDMTQAITDCMVIKYDPTDIKVPGWNMAHGKRSPAQQEAVYNKVIGDKRKAAAATRAARKGTKRKCGEVRSIGSIPRELYIAKIRETGDKRYWDREPKKVLKQHGLAFPE
jgi:hypothetical protein